MLQQLRAGLSPRSRISTDDAELRSVMMDASRATDAGLPAVLVEPADAADLEAVLRWANVHGVRCAVRGAGTGVSGGAVAYDAGAVISTRAFDRIVEIDPVDRVAVVQAGVITGQISRAAREYGLFYAPDPASVELSTIGGNVATNAGGLRGVMYGSTSEHVLGLEAVTGAGERIRVGARTRKNATGYDLTRLLVGSEGTLAVVTEVTVRLLPLPEGGETTFRLTFGSVAEAVAVVDDIVRSGVVLNVLELLDGFSVRSIAELLGWGAVDADATLIGRLVGTSHREDWNRIAGLAQRGGARRIDEGGEELLEARRVVNQALTAKGLLSSCDVAVPVSRLGRMCAAIEVIAERAGRRISIVAHAGDGNLHPTVEADPDDPEDLAYAETVLHEITAVGVGLGGVVTGEHGIGSLKVAELPLQFGEAELRLQREVRAVFDPRGILSPGRGVM